MTTTHSVVAVIIKKSTTLQTLSNRKKDKPLVRCNKYYTCDKLMVSSIYCKESRHMYNKKHNQIKTGHCWLHTNTSCTATEKLHIWNSCLPFDCMRSILGDMMMHLSWFNFRCLVTSRRPITIRRLLWSSNNKLNLHLLLRNIHLMI